MITAEELRKISKMDMTNIINKLIIAAMTDMESCTFDELSNLEVMALKALGYQVYMNRDETYTVTWKNCSSDM